MEEAADNTGERLGHRDLLCVSVTMEKPGCPCNRDCHIYDEQNMSVVFTRIA